jgi:hypothetical protein
MKLLDFLVCDDIRHEQGDKLSFMGVFGDSIRVNVPVGAPKPISLRLSIFLRFMIEDADTLPDSCKVIFYSDRSEVQVTDLKFNTSGRPKLVGIPLPCVFPVSKEATLSLKATFFSNGQQIFEATSPYELLVQISES